MLRVNLKEELDALKNASVSAEQLIEQEVFASQLLAQAGIDTVLLQKQRLARRQQIIRDAYSEEQVKNLCIKYRLRCLDVELFKGKIDEATPRRKQAFEVDFTEAMNQYPDEANYRIVAPSEMFTLQEIQLDPLFMYRFELDGQYYYSLIHQWGGDLSKWRQFINYPLRSVQHLVLFALLIWLPIVIIMVSAIDELTTTAAILQTIFLTAAFTFFTISLTRDRNGQFQTSDRIWDSDEE